MSDLATIRDLFRHNVRANVLVFYAAEQLSDEQLDRALDLGLGNVRAICGHVAAGEVTWMARIEGKVESKWPAEEIPDGIAEMRGVLDRMASRCGTFLSSLGGGDLDRVQSYRDSKGSVFAASLREMLLQYCLHSTHHRAQIVNGIRRVGGNPPEVDYMMMVRRPA